MKDGSAFLPSSCAREAAAIVNTGVAKAEFYARVPATAAAGTLRQVHWFKEGLGS
jgi:hypothetical protein